MPEIYEPIEEQRSESYDPQRFLEIARRRHLHFLVAMLIGFLAVWGSSWVLPARYKSSTLILVERPTMPANYVQPNVSEDIQARLQSITEQILSRTRLLLIIDKLHLYSGGRAPANPDEKVEHMRKDIEIELVHDSKNENITAFRIYYSAEDPRIAQLVTSELTDLFIDENLKVRQQESQDTTKFIESQLEDARQTLAEQEVRVREYQAKHQGTLPSQQTSNLQILSGLQAQLQNEQDALNNAKQQKTYYESLIQQYRSLSGTAGPHGDFSDSQEVDKELETLRAKLANLSSRYKDQYPEVVSTKAEIAKMEKRRSDLLNQGKSADASVHAAEAAEDTTTNPQQLQLESQQRANQFEIRNREQAISDLRDRIGAYQARLNSQPATEQELAELTRGYDQSKMNYDELLKKKNASEMATNMEQMQQGERFRMLDPPSLPIKADSPDRMKFCGYGLGAGIALGLIIVFGFEVFDGRVHNHDELKKLLPMPIISEIPVIALPSELRIERRRLVLGWVVAAVVVATVLSGSAFSYLHK